MLTSGEIENNLIKRDPTVQLFARTMIAAAILRSTPPEENDVDRAVMQYVALVHQQVYSYFAAVGVPEADRYALAKAMEYQVLSGEPIENVYRQCVPPPPPPPPPPPIENAPPRTGAPLSRTTVMVDEDEARVVSEVIIALDERGDIFQRGGKVVEVRALKSIDAAKTGVKRESMSHQIMEVRRDRARALAAETCKFEKEITNGTQDIHVPDWLPGQILAVKWWPFSPLTAIAEAPTMRPDGTLITVPGYDEATGIYLASDLRVNVPEAPTLADAQRAAAMALDVVCDFPFSTPAGRSVWLAGELAVAVRAAIDGPVPMTIVDASMRGSGKSLLADVASIITTGRAAPRMVYSPNDEEMDKRISALALAGDSLVLIDNVVGELGSPSLDAALTGTTYRGRILGKSEMTPHMPMRIGWWATGNGMVVGADLARRSLLVRLEPQCERPEERTGWKYARLLDYVREHRAELLGALLTIIRAYVVAGRPAQAFTPMGSFEAWSDLVRSAIVWCGLADPCATITDVRASDLRDVAFRDVVERWPVGDNVPVTAAELLELADASGPFGGHSDAAKARQFEAELPRRKAWRAALLEWLPPRRGDDLPTAPNLGRALRGGKGAIVGPYKLDAGKHGERGVTWVRLRIDRGALHLVP